MQFNLKNEQISWGDFINEYEKHYFIGYTSKLIRKNFQSSIFVEEKIEHILKNGLTPNDLSLIVAWKLGNIDHQGSNNRVIFSNSCDKNLLFKTQYREVNCSDYFKYIEDNFNYISTLSNEKPQIAFDLLCEKSPEGFGPTYVLTLLFFLTNGNLPIFDKFAYYALLAIKNNTTIEIAKQKVIGYKAIDYGNRGWSIYMNYCKLLLEIAGESYKDRAVDRALWVYGHGFKG